MKTRKSGPSPIEPENPPRPAPRPVDVAPPTQDVDGNRFLLARSAEPESRPRPVRSIGRLLQFKIKHIMYLTVFTAVLMAIRQPLVDSVPLLVTAIVIVSGAIAVLLTVGVYGIALAMDEGEDKDSLARSILYFLTADMLVFAVFFLFSERH